jgi:tRNA threonylcarbamoyladenosine biosynthesis protein TsaE
MPAEVHHPHGDDAMLACGAKLASSFRGRELVFLHGDLGAGKTTLVRGMLRGLGYSGAVPSPTYTLMETYATAAFEVVHMDLYRVIEAGELEMLGVRDFIGECLCLVEWPERGAGVLPLPDIEITITGGGDGRQVSVSRQP